ncbi:MAG: DNA mismatch repair endonuclease MutL [Bacteroidales bacterium]|nr:DNA mismatch repair endonuclease MutL [Bacteroidales bacterium]
MMDIVRLLPDTVANQIAAGEVVQRPSSVIKELLENSIDAHATEVQIVLREAGRELVQVIDNGIGMSPVDARMAFERHATSKISSAADLFELRTMGFRGEALASIAAVAEVELRTRRPEDETGICIRINGGNFQGQEIISCPVGANFQIRNLFYNVPARRKFLKSNQTELSNIISEVQRVALANPQVGFTLIHNDVLQLQLTPGGKKQRITQLFSKTIGKSLLPVGIDNELLSIEGFVCQPDTARKKGALQYFFVNDRFMKHPYFHKAIMESYQDLIPEGTQPNYFIYLNVNPGSIDVNIHPTKTEIKFENEPARWHILMATVREALGKYNEIPAIDFDTADMPDIPVASVDSMPTYLKSSAPAEPKPSFDTSYNPFRSMSSRNNSPFDTFEFMKSTYAEEVLPSKMSSVIDTTPVHTQQEEEMFTAADNAVRPSVRYTQIAGRYIASSDRSGLQLIDQHRAHICILFSRYMSQLEKHQGMSQQELFPEIIEIAPADVPVLESISDELSALGFELDNLGGGSFAVNGRPATMAGSNNLVQLINQMIDVARDQVHKVGDQLNRQLALKMAQIQSINYGKNLTEEEMNQLVENLQELPDYHHTPDGKKVVATVSVKDLDKLFNS